MVGGLRKAIILLVGVVCALVFSRGTDAYAAFQQPTVTLDPITDGLRTPLKLALDTDGGIFVADPRSGGVVRLDQYGVAKQVIVAQKRVNAVALASDGTILVVQDDVVSRFDRSGNEVAQLGSGVGQFVKASAITVDAAGYIYVADAGAYNVKIFTASGTYVSAFGSQGLAPPNPAQPGQFLLPIGISYEKASNQVAVVDGLLGTVQFFTTSGAVAYQADGVTPKKISVSFGSGYGSYPVGVSFEYDVNGALRRTYIVDTFQGQVQAIDSVDASITAISSYGDRRGNLLTPSDVVFDQINSRLLVANGFSNIASFGIEGGKNPVNSTPPLLTIDQQAFMVTSSSAVLTGSVEAGASVVGSADSNASVRLTSAPGAAVWSLQVDSLRPGLNTVSVTAKNIYGASITKAASITYSIPSALLTINSTPTITNQPSIVIGGTTEAGTSITIGNQATRSSEMFIAAGTSWTYQLALAEGANQITVTAGRTGLEQVTRTFSITLDVQNPVASLVVSKLTANAVQNISGSVTDNNGIADVTVNGQATSFVGGVYSTAVALVPGSNTITVVARDLAGNVGVTSDTIVYDPTVPKIAIAAPVDNSYTNVQNITMSGTINKAATVSVVAGNQLFPVTMDGLNWTATGALAAGVNILTVSATDGLNNVAQEKRTITFDAVAPEIKIVSPAQDSGTNVPALTVKGTLGDNIGIKSIKALVNGLDTPVTYANGEFSVFVEFAAEGTTNIAVTVVDVAGNTATALRSVVYDKTPPALSVDPVLVPYPYTLTGTVEVGAAVTVADGNGKSGIVALNGTRWTANLAGVAYDPSSLVVTAVDAVGNSSVRTINMPVPDGDLDGDGVVTIKDALAIIKLVVNNQKPTVQQLAHGDIGPLLNGKANPKGSLQIVDAILVLRKALNLPSWQ